MTELNNGIPLNELEYSYNSDGDYLRIDYPVDMNITGEPFFKEVKELILHNQTIVKRFNQILSNHGTEPPKNNKTLTKVEDDVILQIHNVITHLLEYIQDGSAPNGYSGAKNTLHSKCSECGDGDRK